MHLALQKPTPAFARLPPDRCLVKGPSPSWHVAAHPVAGDGHCRQYASCGAPSRGVMRPSGISLRATQSRRGEIPPRPSPSPHRETDGWLRRRPLIQALEFPIASADHVISSSNLGSCVLLSGFHIQPKTV
ncbi:hypothetical protein FSOLCH5_005789 [Fusarium solani]